MDGLIKLKKKYNEGLVRNKNAEEYFKTHTIEECSKKFKVKNTMMTAFDVFNDVVKNLSELMFKIEDITGKELTEHEKFNGFKL